MAVDGRYSPSRRVAEKTSTRSPQITRVALEVASRAFWREHSSIPWEHLHEVHKDEIRRKLGAALRAARTLM
jgi:hypothetical protein